MGIPIPLEALKGDGVDAGAGLQPNAIENALEVDVGRGGEEAVIGLAWDGFAEMSSTTYEPRNMSSNKQSPLSAQA